MARYQRPVLNFSADDVWAAACAAQRLNGSYVKSRDPADPNALLPNRELVMSFLETPESITQADREQSEKVRTYYKGFTFKVLKGVLLSEFDNMAMVIANRDVVTSTYDLAIICSLPSSYERGVKRDTVNQRIEFATGGHVANVGSKVDLKNAEVVKCNFSQQYGIFFVTVITPEDQVVFFAHKKELAIGSRVNVFGTVKAHRDNSTQLNRAKVL